MRLIFDLFGVLLSSGFKSSRRELIQLLNRHPEQVETTYRKWEIPFDLGEIDAREFWYHITEELQTGVSWQVLNTTVLNSYRPIPGSFELLKRYRSVCPLYLLSNTRKEWLDFLDVKYNFLPFFEKRFLSYELGLRKPDPDVFSFVLNTLGVEPTSVFFVDDEPANIVSASRSGMPGIIFRNAFETELALYSRFRPKQLGYKRTYVGVLLVALGGELILQRRDRKPTISNPGLVTTFGGVVEDGESTIECALREVEEELELRLAPSDLSYLTALSKPEQDGSWSMCTFYVGKNIDPAVLSLQEGEAVERMTLKQAKRCSDLSPVARVVVGHYARRIHNE